MSCRVWSYTSGGGGAAPLLLLLIVVVALAPLADARVMLHNGVCALGKDHVGLCVVLSDCNELTSAPGYRAGDEEQFRCREALRNDLFCCKVDGYIVENAIVTDARRADLLLAPPHCGRTVFATRIAGGVEAALNEFPWAVLLEFTDNLGEKMFRCGATLINDRWLITAAHCVLDPSAVVTGARLGEWNIDTLHDCLTEESGKRECNPPPINVGIDRIIAHPQYDKPNNFSNDIALLRLSFPVSFTETVRPVCLPLHKVLYESNLAGSTVDVVGWGRTGGLRLYSSIKQTAVLHVEDHSKCAAKFAAANLGIDASQFCAVGTIGASTCRGDSGGPLTTISKTTDIFEYHYLAGVVSFGKRVCNTGRLPGVYTRVGAYIEWIKDMMLSNAD